MREIKDLTILVVDDEPDLGELVAFEFELLGARVLNAINGEAAFSLVREAQIDVVVSDIRMPGGDGISLLENLRGVDPLHPPLLFMTGFSDITIEDAYEKGAVAMFGKPFDRNDLIEAVARSVMSCEEKWGSDQKGHEGTALWTLQGDSLEVLTGQGKLRVGRGGFFLPFTEGHPGVSERLRFQIDLSGAEPGQIEGEGVVRWVRRSPDEGLPAGLGLEILSIRGQDRDRVLSWFQALRTVPYIPRG